MNQPTKTKVTRANIDLIAELIMYMLFDKFGKKAVFQDRQKWHEIDDWCTALLHERYTFGYSVTHNDLLYRVMDFINAEMEEYEEVPNVPNQ